MKKTFSLIVSAFLLVGTFVFAEEAAIIDFTRLEPDCIAEKNADGTDKTNENGEAVYQEHKRTLVDFADVAGSSFTNEQKGLMKTSLALRNWEVVLNSSARTPLSVSASVVKPAYVRTQKPGADGEMVDVKVRSGVGDVVGKYVMGVRVSFPVAAVNANARIQPSFEIPAYDAMKVFDENGDAVEMTDEEKVQYAGKTRFEYIAALDGNEQSEDSEEEVPVGYGVVKNVGTIKSLAVTTLCMNFPHSLYVILKDTDNVERQYFMGHLDEGRDDWARLVWNNPSYISDVRAREIRLVPVYPRGLPFVKFVGFKIARDGSKAGGDFIGYFKDVKIIYDKAVLVTERDIVDEDLWGIVGDREAEKQAYEMSRFGEKQVERYIENVNKAVQSGYTKNLGSYDDESAAE
ncbi:MAG: flagellar filament outer layer protein FlaA [Bacteroides sp.]|nr:flagellar filament outer layer protein FlaA [Prevotella sp.]MCM1407802.1 flagellar filament outer layer protein FlaA [Treponema brennaborense]MCM1468850.1 flagellar filament outer layer protein FlaA [Bacteroides sp.]